MSRIRQRLPAFAQRVARTAGALRGRRPLGLDPGGMLPGNRVTLLRDGREAYPAMLDAIATAHSTINLETYILRGDATGERFAAALRARALAGVEVNVLYDALGSLGIDARFFESLRAAGVRVLEYRPLAPWRARWGWLRRDHRKQLVVDGAVGFTGGINIGDEYAPEEEGGGAWHDYHVRIEGPAVRELQALFVSTWNREQGPRLDPERHFPPLAAVGEVPVRILGNREFRARRTIRQSYLRAIAAAEQSVDIQNAYFIPDRAVLRGLRRAARRGVRVRIVLPAHSDVPAVQRASRALYDRMLRDGIELYEWPRTVLHGKIAVVDRAWWSIGSYNLDNWSLVHNLEVNACAEHAPFARELGAAFDEDVAACHRVTLEAWRQRPRWDRWLERAAYALRAWL